MILPVILAWVLISSALPTTQGETVEEFQAQIQALQDQMKEMTYTIKDLARQTMTQQFASEDRVRSNGYSGVRQARGLIRGPKNYYSSTHIFTGFMSMHDHSNYDRTIGMGEWSVALNGVDFRTRHNDYKLVMASNTSTEYHATVDIPFPGVPEAVTKLTNVDDQIEEMREWFKAFKDQDHSVRDYRDFFKPSLCYLEGTWTLDKELDEPFQSDRHQLDADSWFDLMEKTRYTAYTGTKNRLENYAFLPTTIMSVNETTGVPNYAQWNYRILCHPLKEDLPLKNIKQEEDLSYRYPRRVHQSLDQIYYRRAARFRVWEHDTDQYVFHSLIDKLMGQIPGKDNIPKDLRENLFGDDTLYAYEGDNVPLDSGYYNRMFKLGKAGANGRTIVSRGFNDENCYVAKTTQKRVAPMTMNSCRHKKVLNIATGNGKYKGNIVVPYNGTDYEHHYITPKAFFKGRVDNSDPADTVRGQAFVLDKEGNVQATMASGTKIVTETIEGVGQVRLRFPVAPVYGEGDSAWKELNALRDYVFKYGGGNGSNNDDLAESFEFETSITHTPTEHSHTFSVDRKQYLHMKANSAYKVRVTTTQAAGHTHDLLIGYHDHQGFIYYTCDAQPTCWDGHAKKVTTAAA